MTMTAIHLLTVAVLWLGGATGSVFAADLEREFVRPPKESRPWVLWYWMDGQIDRDGITKDLEAMARNGIGGVVLGDIGGTDEGPTKFLSPGWQELFAHTLREAKRLGLVISTCPSAGWCALGGPWIKPEDGMQVLVWSATRVTGPQEFAGILPQPQTVLGHYRDVAVIAFPSPNEPATEIKSINATGTKANARSLVDGNPQTVVTFLALPKDKSPVIEIEFKKPVVLRGISVEFTDPPHLHSIHVEAAGSDGRFRRIGRLMCKIHGGDGSVVRAEIGFDKQAAERLRITLDSGGKVLAAKVAEIELFGENYLRGWTAKTVSHVSVSEAAAVDKHILTVPGIRPESIVNLTGKMSADGRLHWQVPEGQWTILRFGHTARGAKNRPAKAGQGFETDKFRRDVTKFHFDQYIGMMAEKHRKFMGTTLVAMWQDSWETGCQNWSPVFLEEFKRHRGYDPLLYLPAMTGRLVGNGALTERFLWDVRRTIADLAADNNLGALNDLGKAYGIGLWFQPINRHFFDGMQAVGRSTGAEANMHFNRRDQQKRNYGGEKFCASAAHGYGQVVVHSEAATAYPPSGIFVETPASIRELVNANFCTGINNHWIHVFLHQPWQRAEPGLTWAWGLQFQRNNTWFEKLGGWSDYVARSQYMLRQGLPVVDIVCFIGEAVPTAAGPLGSVKELNNLPAGIDYDVCNAEIILTRMSVIDGRIVLPDGMSYALLYLPPKVEAVRPEVLRKIRDLVRDGAILVGNRPTASPSLQNYPACDTEVNQLADEIWGGKIGRVYPAEALKKAISELGLVEDFSFASANPDALIEYYHRRTADTDIYFVANRRPHAVEARCTFRVDGCLPELWHPDTGRIELAGAYEIKSGRTTLPLRFDPHDAVFVVFRKPANKQVARGKNWLEYKPLRELTGPWQISFDPKRGGPTKPVTFEKLQDWSKHDDLGIRYYSGAATYSCRFQISNLKTPIFLDLGEVREVAEIKVNGKNLGILWKTPFRMDITGAVKTGQNTLEIEVVNLWVNRMIGDERMFPDDIEWVPRFMGEWSGFGMKRLPDWFADWDAGRGKRPTGRIVFSTTKFFSAKDPLLPSGLIGPVRLLSD